MSSAYEPRSIIPEFSLLGGPLHGLGSRLGLVRGGTNTFRLGLALGLLAWSALTFQPGFVFIEGRADGFEQDRAADGLGEKVHGPGLHGLDARGDVP